MSYVTHQFRGMTSKVKMTKPNNAALNLVQNNEQFAHQYTQLFCQSFRLSISAFTGQKLILCTLLSRHKISSSEAAPSQQSSSNCGK